MNSRAKGGRTFRKAVAYAKAVYPKATILPMYQISRFAQPQPCDMILLDFDALALLVEDRSNAWGVGKPQTRHLAGLPGKVEKEIWMFQDGHQQPRVRRWMEGSWLDVTGMVP